MSEGSLLAVPDPSVIAESDREASLRRRISPGLEASEGVAAKERVAQAAAREFEFVWRLLRRFGVRPDATVDDAVQRVFEIAARKAESIGVGNERAFLFKTAVLVAAEERRRLQRSRARTAEGAEHELESPDPDPEAALELRRNRQRLDDVLDTLPEKLRSVFVLYEFEGLTGIEIAGLLGVPEGTVASRLRRARERFFTAARRLRAELARRNA